jgi:hypothetical protein
MAFFTDSASTEVESQNELGSEMRPSAHDDSINKMASMLLDDTTIDQWKADPGKRLSQISMSNGPPGMSQVGSQDSKALPQLPSLLFNGDNAWAFKTSPVVTATGSVNEMQFDNGTDQLPGPHGTSYPHVRNFTPPTHSAPSIPSAPPMSSAPPIPRKSSKRKSSRPKSMSIQNGPLARKAVSESISTPNHLTALSQHKSSTQIDPNHVNDKIQQMLTATKDLKGDTVGVKYHNLSEPTTTVLRGPREGAVFHGPMVSTKKRLRDYKVLSRMKSVISDRLNAKTSKKRHDPVRDDRLLDSSLNDFYDDVSASTSAISTLEIGANERK